MNQKKTLKFGVSQINQPTPKLWKRIGNTCIYMLPLMQGLVAQSPMGLETKVWVGFSLSLILVLAKGITKFFGTE